MSEGSWGGPCEFSYPRAVGKNAGEADRGQILEASMASRPPGGCGVGGRASLPLPPPPAVQAAPSVLVRLAPKTRPPPPSRPRPAWGCSPGENDVHCGWRQQLSWSWGIRTGPQGSHRLEEATRGWVQLHGPGSRDAATWLPGDVATRSHPGRSLRWSLRQPLPGPASPSGLGGLNQPCAGPGGVAERLPLSR